MNRVPHLMLSYLARVGVEWRVENGELYLRHADRLTDHDRQWIRDIKPELIDLIESGERVVDTFRWSPRFDTPEHRSRRL